MPVFRALGSDASFCAAATLAAGLNSTYGLLLAMQLREHIIARHWG